MELLIREPRKKPLLIKSGIWIAERFMGKRLIPARLLTWSPRLTLGSAFFEALVVHHDRTLSQRLLKLVRMQVSFFVGCPFCSDLNAFERDKFGISDEEVAALQGKLQLKKVNSFQHREVLALELSRRISRTPLDLTESFKKSLKQEFSDREILILSATISQVNYWARLSHSMGVPPAGFCTRPS